MCPGSLSKIDKSRLIQFILWRGGLVEEDGVDYTVDLKPAGFISSVIGALCLH
jgi:hypothetical protein